MSDSPMQFEVDPERIGELFQYALGGKRRRPSLGRRLWIRIRYLQAWDAPYVHTFTNVVRQERKD